MHREGLHAPYCSAAAFAGDDILVAASADHFAAEGTLYRLPIGRDGPLAPLAGGGLPQWLAGICDAACVDANGPAVALADRAGNVYVSEDFGRRWSHCATGLRGSNGVVVL